MFSLEGKCKLESGYGRKSGWQNCSRKKIELEAGSEREWCVKDLERVFWRSVLCGYRKTGCSQYVILMVLER